MSDRNNLESGDEVANPMAAQEQVSNPVEPDRIVASLAKLYGVSLGDLTDELNGPSILARVARDMLGLERKARRPGRPRDHQTGREVFFTVQLRPEGQSVANAIAKLAAAKGVQAETLQKRYDRERGRRGDVNGLADMFMPDPE